MSPPGENEPDPDADPAPHESPDPSVDSGTPPSSSHRLSDAAPHGDAEVVQHFSLVPELRNAAPDEIAAILRAVMGLSPDTLAPGEIAATLGRPLPPGVPGLDAGRWIAWCLTGLILFDGELPSPEQVEAAGKHLVMVMAMLRWKGNLTRAAQALGISRRHLREGLVASGAYPWPGGASSPRTPIRWRGRTAPLAGSPCRRCPSVGNGSTDG